MLSIEPVDPRARRAVRDFLELPFRIYREDPHWVPPLYAEARLAFDRARHPFYDHSDAAFFVAVGGGRVVGRVAALDHRPYN